MEASPRGIDIRRFPAIPRATKQFERLYRGASTPRKDGPLGQMRLSPIAEALRAQMRD